MPAATLACLSCGSDANAVAPLSATLAVIASPATTDTVQAAPAQALVVQLRGADGAPLPSGVWVYFSAAQPRDTARRSERGLAFCVLATAACDFPATSTEGGYRGGFDQADTTDARGFVRMQVRYSTVAGPTYAIVAAPRYQLRDTLAFTVNPGRAARVQVRVRDTVVTSGARVAESAIVVDRFGNVRADAIGFDVVDTPAYAIDATGAVTTRAPGRVPVLARSGALVDSVTVSVVPRGRIAVYRTAGFLGLYTVNLDGTSARQTAATTGSFSLFPDMAPGGGAVLFTDADSTRTRAATYVIDSSGTNRRRVLPIGAVNPRYSSDGASIYYGYRDSVASLWRARADGSGAERIYTSSTDSYSYPLYMVSPDGLRAIDGYYGRIVTLATGASTTVAVYGDGARWSPDGKSIYYFTNGSAGFASISAIDVDGTHSRPVAPAGRHYSYFDVSPDGAWLIARNDDLGVLELIGTADRSYITLRLGAGLYQPSWR